MGKRFGLDWSAVLIVVAVLLFLVVPWIFGWWVWTWMAPVTFWQKFFMLVIEFFIILTLYGIELTLVKAFT